MDPERAAANDGDPKTNIITTYFTSKLSGTALSLILNLMDSETFGRLRCTNKAMNTKLGPIYLRHFFSSYEMAMDMAGLHHLDKISKDSIICRYIRKIEFIPQPNKYWDDERVQNLTTSQLVLESAIASGSFVLMLAAIMCRLPYLHKFTSVLPVEEERILSSIYFYGPLAAAANAKSNITHFDFEYMGEHYYYCETLRAARGVACSALYMSESTRATLRPVLQGLKNLQLGLTAPFRFEDKRIGQLKLDDRLPSPLSYLLSETPNLETLGLNFHNGFKWKEANMILHSLAADFERGRELYAQGQALPVISELNPITDLPQGQSPVILPSFPIQLSCLSSLELVRTSVNEVVLLNLLDTLLPQLSSLSLEHISLRVKETTHYQQKLQGVKTQVITYLSHEWHDMFLSLAASSENVADKKIDLHLHNLSLRNTASTWYTDTVSHIRFTRPSDTLSRGNDHDMDLENSSPTYKTTTSDRVSVFKVLAKSLIINSIEMMRFGFVEDDCYSDFGDVDNNEPWVDTPYENHEMYA
ncbi:uncharacterized protein BROUX77_003046 [Berkeleyomyces rouxiae]|uniref:uncharacterized protein n=1 Tax=Berkeleyomyces rouxiae TaxID=2035830 RepID=UPI003B7A6778